MVRLKLCTEVSRKLKVQSQFHYGSIKTIVNFAVSVNNSKGLNSTMVRLKLFVRDTTYIVSPESQFHYGSIKTARLVL